MKKIKRTNGFTLVELVVVIAIFAILSTIAVVTSFVLIRKNENKKVLTTLQYNFDMIEKTIKEHNGLSKEDFYNSSNEFDNAKVDEIFDFDQISNLKTIVMSSNVSDSTINSVEGIKLTIVITTDKSFKNDSGEEVNSITKVISAPYYKIFKEEFKLKRNISSDGQYKMVIDNE